MGKQNFCLIQEVRTCTAKTISAWTLCKFYKKAGEGDCKYKESNSCTNPSAWKDSKERARSREYSRGKLTA